MVALVGGLVRFWWVAVLVGAGVVGFFFRDQLTGNVGDLRAGDCFEVPAGNLVTDVQHRPCGEPHTGEVYLIVDIPGDTSAFPDVEAFGDFIDETCIPAFDTFTGLDYWTDPTWDLGAFTPTEAGWRTGDRAVTCYLTRIDGEPFAGSLRKTD